MQHSLISVMQGKLVNAGLFGVGITLYESCNTDALHEVSACVRLWENIPEFLLMYTELMLMYKEICQNWITTSIHFISVCSRLLFSLIFRSNVFFLLILTKTKKTDDMHCNTKYKRISYLTSPNKLLVCGCAVITICISNRFYIRFYALALRIKAFVIAFWLSGPRTGPRGPKTNWPTRNIPPD